MIFFQRILLLLFFISSIAIAQPKINENILSYKIHGDSGEELQRQMNTFGPKTGAEQFNASTQWFVSWHYGYQAKNNACQLTSMQVKVNIFYLFPQWVNYQKSHAMLQKKWDISLRNLLNHESVHGKNGKNAAVAIEKALAKIPPTITCQQLMMTIDNTANHIIKEYLNKDLQYDKLSQHGRV